MAIGTVSVSGNSIIIRDEKGNMINGIALGSGDSLVGYTSTCVSIKKGNWIYMIDEKGRTIGSSPA